MAVKLFANSQQEGRTTESRKDLRTCKKDLSSAFLYVWDSETPST